MKEAMEIMPETLEYGIINSNVLGFLKDIICQVKMGRKMNLNTFLRVRPSWNSRCGAAGLAAS